MTDPVLPASTETLAPTAQEKPAPRAGHGLPPEVAAEFMRRVAPRNPTACWFGQFARSSKGYAQWGLKGRTYAAHRVAYELFNGPIPQGLWVLHGCNHPYCVNPGHLRVGTSGDNRADSIESGVLSYGAVHANLTEHNVRDIKLMRSQGVSASDVARMLCVSVNRILRIDKGELYAEIHGPAPLDMRGKSIGPRYRGPLLNAVEVASIKRSRGNGVSRETVARRFKVSYEVIEGIDAQRHWAHVKGPAPAPIPRKPLQLTLKLANKPTHRKGCTAPIAWSIKRALQAGASVCDAARTHNVATSTVRDIFKRASRAWVDPNGPQPEHKPKPDNSARRAEALRLLGEGVIKWQVHKRTGLDTRTVWKLARKVVGYYGQQVRHA